MHIPTDNLFYEGSSLNQSHVHALDHLLVAFLVKHVDDFDLSRVKDPVVISKYISIDLHFGAHQVAIAQLDLLQFGFGLQDIAVSYFAVCHIRPDPEDVV